MLADAVSQQTEQVGHLKAEIKRLECSLDALNTGIDGSLLNPSQRLPLEFDLVPWFEPNDRYPIAEDDSSCLIDNSRDPSGEVAVPLYN